MVTALIDEHAVALKARECPRLFVDYQEKLGGSPVAPHKMHGMMHEFELCCLAEGRKMMLHAPPEHGKSTHMRGKRLWWRGSQTLAAGERARIMRGMGERFYPGKSDGWWLGIVPPEGTCALISADVGLAKKNLIEISKQVARGWTRLVFPGLRPDIKRSTKKDSGLSEWSSDRLYFEGDVDPSFEVYPAHAAAEGSRFAQLFMDDFFSQEGAESEAIRGKQDRKCRDTWENRVVKGAAALWLNNNWDPGDGFHKRRDADWEAGFSTLWIHYVGTRAIGWRATNAPEGWLRVYGESGELGLWEEVFDETRLRGKMHEDPESMDAWERRWQGGDPPPEGAQFGEWESWAKYDVEEERRREAMGGTPFCFVAAGDPNGGAVTRDGDYAVFFLLRVWIELGFADVVGVWCRRGALSTPREQMAVMFDWHEKLCVAGRQGLRMARMEEMANKRAWLETAIADEQEARREAGRMWWNAPVSPMDPDGEKRARIHASVGPHRSGMIRWPDNLGEKMRGRGQAGLDWRTAVKMIEVWTADPRKKPRHDDAPDAYSMAWKVARGQLGVGSLMKMGVGRVTGGERKTGRLRV